ncbi:MAG TPA: hypothetical protein VKE69_12425, partial [Planctomycetota bacterium]|nr:hypothetical protein [Planctomycetota bacterium]
MGDRETVLVVDFGSQFTQLLARRIREQRVYCEIVPPARAILEAKRLRAKAIVLSGGPHSVYDADAPKLDVAILSLGVPVLGVCYGMQWVCRELGGDVRPSQAREYGRAEIERTVKRMPAVAKLRSRDWLAKVVDLLCG